MKLSVVLQSSFGDLISYDRYMLFYTFLSQVFELITADTSGEHQKSWRQCRNIVQLAHSISGHNDGKLATDMEQRRFSLSLSHTHTEKRRHAYFVCILIF